MNHDKLSAVTLMLLILLMLYPAMATGALRCGTALIDRDAWPYEVEKQCGKPDYIAIYPTASVPGLGIVQTEEHWFYNDGPQRFIRKLTFRNGKLTNIESLGYGFHPPSRPHCSPSTLRHITNEYELIARCGEPVSKRVEWRSPITRKRTETWQVLQPVFVQEWLYDFSSNQFRQVVTIENGRIVGVESRPNK
ncbi:DUF2845 domain-containing protein [Marinobacter salinisoli]|uniref:DUF2845 domain-containing protein n=1 Tax=Marinobacter salinisoli TaxID=2769486 RepID=A0ABX7MPE2_9GAMM|nr:DUF2845 domain-containing protein [Marinobacter salinisoli]QSP94177.1 DUF2845 domain-containing protein [Marinobacter salinisoli]